MDCHLELSTSILSISHYTIVTSKTVDYHLDPSPAVSIPHHTGPDLLPLHLDLF